MEGLLAGGLAAPDRPRGPERLPGPAPREDIEGGAEAAEGEGDIFRSTHYLPITKEGPRDILDGRSGIAVANFDPGTFSLMRCDFCGAGFDTRAGLSSHARAHLRDFGITNWELTISPINILQELLATSAAELPPSPLGREPGGPPGSFLTSRRPRLPLTMPFPPTWAEDPGPIYGDGKGREQARLEPFPFPKASEGWMGELGGVHSAFLEAFHLSVILALR